MYFCVVLCIVCSVTFSVLFVCVCVLYYCHPVATQLQLNISYQLKNRHFFFDAEVITAKETWLDEQPSEFYLSGLQKLEFGGCSLFPFWSDQGLISTPGILSLCHRRSSLQHRVR